MENVTRSRCESNVGPIAQLSKLHFNRKQRPTLPFRRTTAYENFFCLWIYARQRKEKKKKERTSILMKNKNNFDFS